MNIEVEAISNEIIKPSYPTPKNLGRYQLSLLDQSSPKFYNPLVFYYTMKTGTAGEAVPTSTIPIILKKSLSAVLTHYYPLAGRLEKHGNFIHCNDEGIPFVETQVNGQLSQVMSNPVAQELDIFCPFMSRHDDGDDAHQILLGVQLNMFECGGIAVGVSFSDKIADALSWMRFFRTWAAMARSPRAMLPKSLRPEFVSAALFPPRPQPMIDAETCVMKKGIVTKIFVFNGFAIEALRAMYWDKNGDNIRPSRVETLSTFLISRFEAAMSRNSSRARDEAKERFYTILHTVNLHPRMDPPLAENSFGNFLVFAEDEQLSMIQERSKDIEKRGGEVIEFQVTSLSRFHFYEIDFGWGKPDWSSTAAWNFDKIIAFLDTSDGDGIEAYVSLREEDMAKFETDKELRKFTSSLLYIFQTFLDHTQLFILFSHLEFIQIILVHFLHCLPYLLHKSTSNGSLPINTRGWKVCACKH
ncbi:stemmadenine O-acetyltransferase-like [Humulus lupulus]|uniref:stemmadenine O-acetyltransferase-like n=1 Tax=Humulus lupulus TaxID=3486 RepID=UPI002B412BE8|nr:stemmadenine O-acetyltransferase-like [Humulus lupulus]